MAEVIKVGLIKSKELIDYLLEEKIDNLKMIQMAVKIKKKLSKKIHMKKIKECYLTLVIHLAMQ